MNKKPDRKHRSYEKLCIGLIVALAIGIGFTACETTKNADGTTSKTLTPQAQTALTDAGVVAENALLTAGNTALQQVASGGKLNSAAIIQNSASSAATSLRSLQGTGNAANPSSVQLAITSASSPAALPAVKASIAPAAADQITAQVKSGIPPDAANENVALGLDSLAAVANIPAAAKAAAQAGP